MGFANNVVPWVQCPDPKCNNVHLATRDCDKCGKSYGEAKSELQEE